ncbi:MAG: hypothetical protein NDJ24_03370 [Alphaproteobacteria bacterium]|nr:hypothetical protein [Alphaproteobacteria bacterium]
MSVNTSNHLDNRSGEEGNVLFLILVAVVLFAALSYAVTRTSSNNSGTVDNEKDKIAAAQMIQYPAGLRSTILRMEIGGTSAEDLRFDSPADFTNLSNLSVLVFHPQGGGGTFVQSPPDLMAGEVSGNWYFNAEFEIENLGLNHGGQDIGNDIVAFLPGVKRGICMSVNEDLGVGSIPQVSADVSGAYMMQMIDGYSFPAGEVILGTAGANGSDLLTGQPFGCFQNSTGEYVYYHVLADR